MQKSTWDNNKNIQGSPTSHTEQNFSNNLKGSHGLNGSTGKAHYHKNYTNDLELNAVASVTLCSNHNNKLGASTANPVAEDRRINTVAVEEEEVEAGRPGRKRKRKNAGFGADEVLRAQIAKAKAEGRLGGGGGAQVQQSSQQPVRKRPRRALSTTTDLKQQPSPIPNQNQLNYQHSEESSPIIYAEDSYSSPPPSLPSSKSPSPPPPSSNFHQQHQSSPLLSNLPQQQQQLQLQSPTVIPPLPPELAHHHQEERNNNKETDAVKLILSRLPPIDPQILEEFQDFDNWAEETQYILPPPPSILQPSSLSSPQQPTTNSTTATTTVVANKSLPSISRIDWGDSSDSEPEEVEPQEINFPNSNANNEPSTSISGSNIVEDNTINASEIPPHLVDPFSNGDLEITPEELDHLDAFGVEGVNGNTDMVGGWREWHETLTVDSGGENPLIILPYCVIDF